MARTEQPAPPRQTPVDVVIVNYNTRDQLADCICAVQADGADRLVVVDNASTDGSAAMVRARFPDAELHANPRNVGYGAAANQGMASCRAEYMLLLNSDTLVTPRTLQALSAYLDSHPRVGLVGPRLVGSDGRLQVSCFPFWLPGPLNALAAESASGRLLAYTPGFRQHFVPRGWDTPAGRVPWVAGAAIALRREAVEAVNGFDEAFFMYFEEVDLCLRLAHAGWEVHFAPVTTVVHVGGLSTRQRRTEMAAQYLVSTLIFYRRHYPGPRLPVLKVVVTAIGIGSWLADRARLWRVRDNGQRMRLEANLSIWQGLLRMLRDQPTPGGRA